MKQINSLIKQMTPEEIELEKKRAELLILEDELAQRELDLTTLHVDLKEVRRLYLIIVGVKFSLLDNINAQIAELRARLNPKDKDAHKEAIRSRTQAKESANATGSIEKEEYKKEPFKPSENLKQLYRDLAKKVHPDLAPDKDARVKRHKFMQEVNRAYAAGDEERLRSLINEWERSPDAVFGEGTGAELIRIIRQIAVAINRIDAIGKEIENLKKSELYILKTKIEKSQNEGRDILSEMAAEVDAQIKDANTRLRDMKQNADKKVHKDRKRGIH